MCNPLDPTVLHSAECVRCGVTVRDADNLDDGYRFECLAEIEDEEEAEAASVNNPEP